MSRNVQSFVICALKTNSEILNFEEENRANGKVAFEEND
jgi:hypothetical protein